MNTGNTLSTVTVYIVAAFAEHPEGGNLAGVVLDRADLDEDQMQQISARIALSETAFVKQVPGGFFVDFFTPAKRVPDCGHASVAAFHLLDSHGRIEKDATVKYVITGSRPIRLGNGSVAMAQPFPNISAADPRLAVDAGLGGSALAGEPAIARHDVGFLLVPISTRETLAALVPDLEAIRAMSIALEIAGIYAFTVDAGLANPSARMWAPAYGINEEAATGMAAGALAGYLYSQNRNIDTFTIEQGRYMNPPSPSVLHARIEHVGATPVVWVSGRAITRQVDTIDLAGPS